MDKMTIRFEKGQADSLIRGFRDTFGADPERFFSAPGRTEIGGNHTDHQRGRVLAAAVNVDTRAAVRLNGTNTVNVYSKGFAPSRVDLADLSPREEEKNHSASLIRGVLSRFRELGCDLRGFDMYTETDVLSGSGLSSSAAFEVLMGTAVNGLLFGGQVDQPKIAMIGQYAENVYYGKPCGLMDQTASAVGGMVAIDFFRKDQPVITPVDFDFASCGHALCIIDTHADHADLTDEYASIPGEMKMICAHFGKEVLSQIPEEDFFREIPALRRECGDRAVIRAYHFYQDNARVPEQVEALKAGDFDRFLNIVKKSGYSSYMYLQNVIPTGYRENQAVAVALIACDRFLQGRGAFRVHGGGFAGTVQAFVPMDLLESFRRGIDGVLGEGSCHVMAIRPQGGVEAQV